MTFLRDFSPGINKFLPNPIIDDLIATVTLQILHPPISAVAKSTQRHSETRTHTETDRKSYAIVCDSQQQSLSHTVVECERVSGS